MTSRAAVSHFEIFDVIKNFELCKSDDKLKSKKDHVWVEICSHWMYDSGKYRMEPVNLYFYVYQNRNGIYESYKKYRGEIFTKKKDDSIEESNQHEERHSDETSEQISDDFTLHPQNKNHPSRNKILNFKITFSEAQWSLIKPVEKFDKNNKSYFKFQNGWTHIVCEMIYLDKKLPCAFNLKTHNIFKDDSTDADDNMIIKMDGFCTEKNCKAAIYGEGTYKLSQKGNISINIITLDTKEIAHKKKRHVSGPLRHEFKKELKMTKAENFRERLIHKFHEYGEQIPPIIPNRIVCHKIKQEAINEDLGIKGTLWESLSELKHNVEFRSAFQQLGFDKFFLFYWTPEQIDVFNDLLTLEPAVSIDASGSIARRILRQDNYSNGPIFLYQIVTYIGKLIVPVCQMLSERHDTKIIEFWLKEWLSNKAKIPLEIVTDMSKPLQNAICLATNNITYNQYLSMCYRFLINKSKVLMKPYLRIDIAHFIYWVSRLSSFAKTNLAVKDFYLRALGLMTTANNLEMITKLMRAVLKICQNNYGCSEEIKWLLDKIKTFKFDDSVNYKDLKHNSSCSEKNLCEVHLSCQEEFINLDDIEHFWEQNDELSNFIDNLITETCMNNSSNKSINYNDINSYYHPGIVPDLKILLKKFPSWSNVMKPHYNCSNNVPSSARSENYFKFVKNNLLESHQPIRVDKFLIKHIRTIWAKVKEARAAIELLKIEQKQLDKDKNKKRNKIKINSIFNLQENWKNQVKPENVSISSSEDSEAAVEESTVISDIKFNEDSVPKPVFVSTPIKNENVIIDDKIKLSESPIDSPNKHLVSSSINSTCLILEQKSESNFSIQLESKQPRFELKCNKLSKKRKDIDAKDSGPQQKRGKYLTPFPEVQVHHDNLRDKKSRKTKSKKKIISNGMFIPAYPIKGKKLTLYNTCPFDSLMEILSFTYLNYNNFKNFVDSQVKPNSFFSCLLHYAKFGANVAFNKKRLSYLSDKYPTENCTVNCRDDVSEVFARIMHELDCNTEQSYCQNNACNYIKTVKDPVLNISAALVWENGFKSLKDSVCQELKKKKSFLV